MKVAIIGGGAVGLLIASQLSMAQIHPIVYTRRQEQAQLLNEKGIDYVKEGMKTNLQVEAYCFQDGVKSDVNLCVVAVKQYDLKPIINKIIQLQWTTPILFLQNGMSHIQYLSSLPSSSIFLGIVEHGVMKKSDHSLLHTGVGKIKVGIYRGDCQPLYELKKASQAIHFPIIVEEDWHSILLEKLVVNAIINPLTALYKVQNGQLLHTPAFFYNMKQIFQEVVQALQITNKDKVWKQVVTVCQNTAANYSSMFKDMEWNHKTEIDAILGYIIECGNKKNIAMPLLNFVYYSIKGMETTRKEEGNG